MKITILKTVSLGKNKMVTYSIGEKIGRMLCDTMQDISTQIKNKYQAHFSHIAEQDLKVMYNN